jgi:hypothetical protein
MFGHRGRDDLGRRLRDERPQPDVELVQRVAAQIVPSSRQHRSFVPRAAAVLAATSILVAALGVAGAIGSASNAVQSFGRGVFNVVKPARSTTLQTPATTTSGNAASTLGLGRVHPLPPFGWQYGGNYPICWHGQIVYVHWWQLFWYFLHGATSGRSCVVHPHP